MNITTLIPAYKPKYIPELLTSLRNQSYAPQRIIISDDSPNGEYRQELYSEKIRPLLTGLNIDFVEGRRNGAYENVKHLVNLWNGSSDLVHIFLDDDVVYPEFYERHLIAHKSAQLSCSISRRWTANEAGTPITLLRNPDVIRYNSNRILLLESDFIFSTSIAECLNWFGELSNTVMRGNTLEIVLKGELGNVPYLGLGDLGYFLAASLQAPIAYIQDPLGYFRTGSENHSSDPHGFYRRILAPAQAALALGAFQVNKLSLKQKLNCYTIISRGLNPHHAQLEDMKIFHELIPQMATSVPDAEDKFLKAWQTFLQIHSI